MRKVLGFLSGLLLLVSGFFHSYSGLPPLSDALAADGVSAEIHLSVIIGWVFGSVAMLAFGVMMLVWALRVHRGESPSTAPAGAISVAYLCFGAVVFHVTDHDPRYLLFIITALLVGATVNWRRLMPTKAV
ncbi:MAG: hypothetical protein AAF533_18725 [Acidobacteriota bacterium]